jgi:hypothetical protein
MSAKGHTIRVGRSEIYAEVEGEGSLALVFIHYWGGSRRTWSEVIARLAPRTADAALRTGRAAQPVPDAEQGAKDSAIIAEGASSMRPRGDGRRAQAHA